jgi:DNA polymerase-3 subunit gamma/tau
MSPALAIVQSGSIKVTPKLASLSAIQNKISAAPEAQKNDEELVTANVANPVDQAELLKCWNEYAEIKRQAGDMNHFVIFANRKIVLHPDMTIAFEVDNQLQLDILKELRGDVLEYLRNKVQNSSLQLDATISQSESKKQLYTNQDKFNYLLEHYPQLEELRRRLGLELH